jgi:hypothetical protein
MAMNERIQKLAEQAGIKLPDDSEYNGHIYRNTIEKFARLIVRECAQRVDYWESKQGEHTEDLLKHFGVEQ